MADPARLPVDGSNAPSRSRRNRLLLLLVLAVVALVTALLWGPRGARSQRGRKERSVSQKGRPDKTSDGGPPAEGGEDRGRPPARTTAILLDVRDVDFVGAFYIEKRRERGASRTRAYPDRDGLVRFDVEPGEYTMRWSDRSWGERYLRASVRDGETKRLHIAARGHPDEYPIYPRLGRIEVAVHDPWGAPVVDAPVRIWRDGWKRTWEARTLADGRCRLHPAPGTLTLTVGDLHRPVQVERGVAKTVVVQLAALGQVSMRFRAPVPVLVREDGTRLGPRTHRAAAECGWRFVFLAPGSYRVESEDGRELGAVTVRSHAETQFEHRLAGGHVVVKVRFDPRTAAGALADARRTVKLTARGLSSGADFAARPSREIAPQSVQAWTATFQMAHLAAGHYAFRAQANGGTLTGDVAVDVPGDGGTVEPQLTLRSLAEQRAGRGR